MCSLGHIVAELPGRGHDQVTGPVRTCIGCRKHGSRSELVRLVAQGSGSPVVVVDERRRMTGRGAWLHPDQKCLALAIKRRAFGRALQGAAETTAVERRFMSGMPPVEAPAATGNRPNLKAGQKSDGNPMSSQR